MEQPSIMEHIKNHVENHVRQIFNWHERHEKSRTVGQFVADMISKAAGSWVFLLIHAIWFFIWIAFKVEPYPYGLLTMIVSLEAIFLSTFILISQNRASDRDHAQALQDYETNMIAKEEIEMLMTRLDTIEEKKINKILAILEETKK